MLDHVLDPLDRGRAPGEPMGEDLDGLLRQKFGLAACDFAGGSAGRTNLVRIERDERARTLENRKGGLAGLTSDIVLLHLDQNRERRNAVDDGGDALRPCGDDPIVPGLPNMVA